MVFQRLRALAISMYHSFVRPNESITDHVCSQMSVFFLMWEPSQLRNPSIIFGKHLMSILMLVVPVEKLQPSRAKLGGVY